MEITLKEKGELITKAYYRGFLGGSLITAIIVVVASIIL